MGSKIYVGNLPYNTSVEALASLFSQYGELIENGVQIISDRETGRSKGFGFVEMKNSEDAAKAIENLNGYELEGRKLVVNEARPKQEGGSRNRSFGGGYNRSGRGRGGDSSYSSNAGF